MPAGIALALAWFASASAIAQVCGDDWSAEAISVEGVVEVRRSGSTDWSSVRQGDTFCVGDSIRLAAFSCGALLLPD